MDDRLVPKVKGHNVEDTAEERCSSQLGGRKQDSQSKLCPPKDPPPATGPYLLIAHSVMNSLTDEVSELVLRSHSKSPTSEQVTYGRHFRFKP